MNPVELICKLASERKAEDIVVMDMKGRSAFCDTYIVMSAPSTVRVRAIADHIELELKKQDRRVLHREGYQDSLWVLLDFGSIVVHIFLQETRKFYDLENLWGDAPKHAYAE